MIFKKYLLLILLFLCLFLSVSFAQEDINKNFRLGNSYYEKAQYDKAIEEYEKILKNEIKNAIVYYNLGNAYYKSGRIGNAIVNFERARLLSPRDTDININLKFAKLKTKDKIPEINEIMFDLIMNYATDFFTINELTLASSVTYFLLLGLLFLIILSRKKHPAFLSIFILFFALTITSLVYKIMDTQYTKKGIVLADNLEVRSGPGSDNTLIYAVNEGTKVEILKEDSDYYEIILPNGEKGWTDKKKIEPIF
ncbi:tetratricopeptide repeat protein [Candidatus Desantisbacteria bacterium]|nr:tetratricopeptide repeat protein [Candidatus Desantisbacteria bacterium]